jgi:hypothetical protein
MNTKRCSETKEANEYCRVPVVCELAEGHQGPHFTMLGPYSSCCWTNVSFQLNYITNSPSEDLLKATGCICGADMGLRADPENHASSCPRSKR